MNRTRQLILGAVLIAFGLIVPSIFHYFSLGGRVFLPMHIPVLLAGQSVPHILNRDRSDLCPIEQLASDLTPDCVESLCIRIESFFEKIAQNQKGK